MCGESSGPPLGHGWSIIPVRWAGRMRFAAGVRQFVAKGERVEFLVPAFPYVGQKANAMPPGPRVWSLHRHTHTRRYKSRNHQVKTAGELPDIGEALSISRLARFCEAFCGWTSAAESDTAFLG